MHDPSSTHSSPRSFHSDLSAAYPSTFPHYTPHHHSQTYPIPNYPGRPAHKSTLPVLPISLSVSTSTTASEHDPNEQTARPSNAHKHARFLAGALTSSDDTSRSLLFSDPSTSDDPGATPVVTHPPSTTSAAGLPTPLNSAEPAPEPPSTASSAEFSLSNTPGLSRGLTRPLCAAEQEKLAHLDRLKFFLATAPSQWDNARPTQSFAPTTGSNAYPSAGIGPPSTVGSSTGWGMGLPTGSGPGAGPGVDAYTQGMHPSLNRFMLPSQEFVTCVLWNGLYHITGTDIVRALVFRFEAFGRPVRNMKKFEEGVFSDLRNLKPGVDACLEEPKSPFLDLLFKYQCIRTQKKQKVFYWFSVPHDRLFLDALERDLKREKMGLEPTTHVVGEPAASFMYDAKRSLYEQFAKAQGIKEGEGELESTLRRAELDSPGDGSGISISSESDAELLDGATGMGSLQIDTDSEMSDVDDLGLTEEEREKRKRMKQEQRKRHLSKVNGGGSGPGGAAFFSNLLFEGSPTYKQRRKKTPAAAAAAAAGSALSRSVSSSSSASSFRRGSEDFDERGRPRSMGSYGSGLAERHHHQSASVSRERSYPYPQPYSILRHNSQGGGGAGAGGGAFPSYSSMSEEFGPGSLDARERSELDAASLFRSQARGELMPADGVVRKPKVPHVHPEVGVMISEGYTAHQLQNPNQQNQFTGQQQQPSDLQQLEAFSGFDPSGFPQQTQQPQGANGEQQNAGGTTQYETVSPDGKFRAFMCPLYSCGRLFKRMEHLKRHLRTHTMERPYTCPICQKRFSRSDNMTQHLRTHERTGSALANAGGAGSAPAAAAGFTGNGGTAAGGGIGGTGNGVDDLAGGGAGGAGAGGLDVNAMGGLDFGAMGMWRDNGEDSDLSGAESEGFDDEGYTLFSQQQHQHQHGQHQHQHQQHQMMPGMFGLGMFGGADAGMGVGDAGVGASAFDMQMCEIEVQAGDVSEIPGGEEEGLLLRNHHHHPHHHSHQQQQQQQQQHHAMAQFANLQAQQEQNAVFGSGANGFGQERTQWAQSQQSPAFSTLSVPSPPPGPQGMTINSRAANRSSLGSTPAGFMSAAPGRPTHSASNSVSSIYQNSGANGVDHAGAQEDFVVTSMSAPSHKQAFDHAGLYPPGILESAVSAGPNPNAAGASASAAAAAAAAAAAMAGPIRRHRSMTPSLIGRASGESIRRPMSTASNASGSGSGDATGSGSASPVPVPVSNVMGGMMGMGRGYHPYAGGYASSSRSGSTHSSPAVYNVPLGSAGGEQQQQQQVRRSESRASFVAEQMMQGGAGAQEMFRTSSPGSFMPQHVAQMQATESPAPYTMELPPHQMYGHANTLPVGAYDAHVQQQQQQQQQEGGYYPQTHATL